MKKEIIILVLLISAFTESAIAQWSKGGFGNMEKPFILSFYLRASIGFGSFKALNK